jgi:hypothetical protein
VGSSPYHKTVLMAAKLRLDGMWLVTLVAL